MIEQRDRATPNWTYEFRNANRRLKISFFLQSVRVPKKVKQRNRRFVNDQQDVIVLSPSLFSPAAQASTIGGDDTGVQRKLAKFPE